jgi:PAS domain S-box-containing protein
VRNPHLAGSRETSRDDGQREALDTLAAAFRHAAIGIRISDAQGRPRDANPALARMLGVAREELLALPDEAITHPDDRDDDARLWHRLAAGEIDTYQREKRYPRKDGTLLWGLVNVSALRDDDGRFLGSLAQIQNISDRKRAEDALREHEARLEALVSQLPIVLYTQPWGGNHDIGYVSPRFEEQIGLTREDLPRNFVEILQMSHADDHARIRAVNDLANRTGETVQAEYRLRGGNGEWFWVDHRAVLMRDERGRPLTWHGSIIDISERKRLEASLRASEIRFRRAFEGAAIGMALSTPDDICVDANEAYCAIVGRPREALIGQSLIDLTVPGEQAAASERLEMAQRGTLDSYVVEKRYRRPEGQSILGRLTLSAVRDETGALLYCIGQLQDITGQKATEEALRESEALLRTVMAQMPAAVYRLESGPNGCFTFASPRFEEMTGLSLDDGNVRQSDFVARIHPDDLDAFLEANAYTDATGEPFNLEYRLLGQDGSWFWVQDCSAAMLDGEGRPVTWHGVLLDINERKRLQAAVQEHEAEMRALIEHLPVALYSTEPSPGDDYLYTSPQFALLTGMGPDDIARGTAALDARIHPDDLQRVLEAGEAVDSTGALHEIEYRVRAADGRWRWVHDRAGLARDDQGRPVAWHGVLLDVSEQRRLEESLRVSEARFRSTFEGAGIGMTLADPRGRYIDVNPAFCWIVGRSREELLRCSFVELTHPDDRAAGMAMAERLQRGEVDAYAIEKRYLRPDGQTIWAHLTVTAVRGPRNEFLYEIAQVQDITAQKAAETALRESEARFRALVQHDPDVVVIVDKTMTLTYVSPSSLAAFGLPPDEVPPTVDTSLDRIHEDDQERVIALFAEVRDVPGAVAATEGRLWHTALGWRWFQISIANLLEDPGIRGYLFNLSDITGRKQAEIASAAALEAQEAAIVELQRLSQSKSRFLSTISHEFRTPLTAIIGYSEFLADNPGQPALVSEDAAVIHREASRLSRMVDEVLFIDRADAGHLALNAKVLDLNALVERVVTAFRPLAEQHAIALELDPDLPSIEGEQDRLAQALTNLLSNAVKYSPDGGTVTIATRAEGDEVILSVRDEGLGIAANDLQRVFDRFERVEQGIAGRIAGTGLGLPIVREIATLHRGRVWVESEIGFGSVFSVALPVRQGDG